MRNPFVSRRWSFGQYPLGKASALASCALVAASAALASSHREAPFITEIPKLDATDFYMFNSYEADRGDFVTAVACYIPFQIPYGGPNFFNMDPEARYEIKMDNDGDAREDLTFRFTFKTINRDVQLNIGGQMVSVPLINVGAISAADNSNQNVIETYTLEVIYGLNGQPAKVTNLSAGGTSFLKPADNIGAKSIPNYEDYARAHIYDIAIPGFEAPGRVFVGQRKDPFVVNLGEAFDLFNLNPLGPVDGKIDTLEDDNITALVLELPKSSLTKGSETIIGGWTAASLPKNRMLRKNPTFNNPANENGNYIQVSRLGMPLVNELIIGVKDKNKFNGSDPREDAQFATYVTNPTLPALLAALFPVQAPCTPRNDLVAVFLTGVSGLNQPANVRAAEMLRLNTAIAAVPRGVQSELGVLGNDTAGFPNGRRPGDDVVDIALRVVMGALLDSTCAPSGQLAFTDGAFVNDQNYDDVFPYLRTPIASSPNSK